VTSAIGAGIPRATGAGFGLRHGIIEHAPDLGDLDASDAQTLHPATFPADEFDCPFRDPEQLGDELLASDVGATVDRWRGDPHMERVTSRARHGGSACAGLHI
jgi:hypothetical protein